MEVVCECTEQNRLQLTRTLSPLSLSGAGVVVLLCREINATKDMVDRVVGFYEHWFSFRSLYDEERIMAELPPMLRKEVCMGAAMVAPVVVQLRSPLCCATCTLQLVLCLSKDIITKIPFFAMQVRLTACTPTLCSRSDDAHQTLCYTHASG